MDGADNGSASDGKIGEEEEGGKRKASKKKMTVAPLKIGAKRTPGERVELIVDSFFFGLRPRRGTKSCRTQGESVRMSVRPSVRPYGMSY